MQHKQNDTLTYNENNYSRIDAKEGNKEKYATTIMKI